MAELPILQRIVRMRWVWFGFVAMVLIASYNGHWRVGRDSALYRSVAESIAAGEGYKYRGERERHVYQGLPRLLAGVDRVFGPQDPMRPRAAQAVMLGIALFTLYVVYHMVRVRYPRWVAVCVTTGVGINPFFVNQAHELMTDAPFLLGVCLALLGLAKLSKCTARRCVLWGGVAVLGGLLAISMRPTFVPLAAAFALSCSVGVLRSRRWGRYGIGFGLLVLLLAAYWFLDPRLDGNILNGRYEEIAFSHAMQIGSDDWWYRLGQTVNRHLPESLFVIEFVSPFGAMLLLFLIGGAVAMMRRDRLWGIYVLMMLAMILALGGSKPRYFLMVLPLLLAEWAMLAAAIAVRLRRWPHAPSIAMLAILGAATIPSILKSADFVREQWGWTRRLEKKPFQEVCNNGRMQHMIRLAGLISRTVPEGQKVLGPEPRVLTFLSGRSVYHPSELQPPKINTGWTHMLDYRGVSWCVFGPRLAADKRISSIVEKRLIAIDRSTLVKLEGMYLVRIISPKEHRERIEQARKEKQKARLEARRAGKIPLTTQPSTRLVKKRSPATQPAPATIVPGSMP